MIRSFVFCLACIGLLFGAVGCKHTSYNHKNYKKYPPVLNGEQYQAELQAKKELSEKKNDVTTIKDKKEPIKEPETKKFDKLDAEIADLISFKESPNRENVAPEPELEKANTIDAEIADLIKSID